MKNRKTVVHLVESKKVLNLRVIGAMVAEKIKKSTALILYFVMSTVTFLSRPILTVQWSV